MRPMGTGPSPPPSLGHPLWKVRAFIHEDFSFADEQSRRMRSVALAPIGCVRCLSQHFGGDTIVDYAVKYSATNVSRTERVAPTPGIVGCHFLHPTSQRTTEKVVLDVVPKRPFDNSSVRHKGLQGTRLTTTRPRDNFSPDKLFTHALDTYPLRISSRDCKFNGECDWRPPPYIGPLPSSHKLVDQEAERKRKKEARLTIHDGIIRYRLRGPDELEDQKAVLDTRHWTDRLSTF
ncbi:hypothetical protein BDZ89DRAFT_1050375 [Hymenopellis radicata]|nr:hypothetical protein BDZ89DRAFT_1050375 [Hymenopellis radicata]